MASSSPFFSPADVMAIFGLKDDEAVENLIRAGVLEISAYTTKGQPLFSRESVVRAGRRILPRPERPSAEQSRR